MSGATENLPDVSARSDWAFVVFVPEAAMSGVTSFRGWRLRPHQILRLPTKFERKAAAVAQVLNEAARAAETGRHDCVACGSSPAEATQAADWYDAGNRPAEAVHFLMEPKSGVTWPVAAVMGAQRVDRDEAETAGFYTRAAQMLSDQKADVGKRYPPAFGAMIARPDSAKHLSAMVQNIGKLFVPDPAIVLALGSS
jgi:hypothetical protein